MNQNLNGRTCYLRRLLKCTCSTIRFQEQSIGSSCTEMAASIIFDTSTILQNEFKTWKVREMLLRFSDGRITLILRQYCLKDIRRYPLEI